MSVRVGTSGWSYPGGRGTWNGLFYPAKGARPRGFDELEFYARWFDAVEVNSTFYGQPRAKVTANAAQLRQQLGLPPKRPLPSELLEAYPWLAVPPT